MSSLMICPNCSRQQHFDFDWIPLRLLPGFVRLFAYGKCGHSYRQNFECKSVDEKDLLKLTFEIRSLSPFGSVARASALLPNGNAITQDLDLNSPDIETDDLGPTIDDDAPQSVFTSMTLVETPTKNPRH